MANVSLYIDDFSIRLLITTGKGVKKWAELPLESGLVKDRVIVDEVAVASAIRRLFDTEGLKTRRVITSLSGLHCVSRLITLPRLPKSLLPEAIMREAERLLPVPLEKFYLSWQTISRGKDEINIFLIAFPRDAADALTKTLRKAGLDPYLIDVKPLALARVVDKSTAIVADVQHNELDIVVIVDRIPQLIRTISLPRENQSRQKKMAVIREELDRTINFYNSSHGDNPLDSDIPIFVSGELVKESEEGITLAGNLKTFAIPLLSPIKYHRALPPSRYMVNVGLALKKVSQSKNTGSLVNLNTLPQANQPKARSLGEIIFVPGIVVALAALAFPIMFVQSAAAETESLRSKVNFINQRYHQVQAQKKAITELQAQVSRIDANCKNLTQTLQDFEEGHESVNNDLAIVTSGLSSNLELNGIAYTDDKLSVSGTAPDEALILGYAKKLRASDRFKRVIVSVTEKTGEEMSFTFTLIK